MGCFLHSFFQNPTSQRFGIWPLIKMVTNWPPVVLIKRSKSGENTPLTILLVHLHILHTRIGEILIFISNMENYIRASILFSGFRYTNSR